MWKFLERWEYQSTLPVSCLYVGQETMIRTEPRTADLFEIGKGTTSTIVILFN